MACNRKMRWKIVLLFSAVLLLVSFLSCAGEEEAPKELKIGVINAVTGPGALYGIGWINACKMIADDINEAGGLTIGGEKYMLKVIVEDDQFSSTGGKAAAEKLVHRDEVKFIHGPVFSGSVLSVQTVTEPANVVLLCDGLSPAIVSPDKPFTFRMLESVQARAYPGYPWIAEHFPEIKTLAFFYSDNEAGVALSTVEKEAAIASGFSVVSDSRYDPDTKDFYSALSPVIAKNPDLICLCSPAPGTACLILKQAYELGYGGKGNPGKFFDSSLVDIHLMEEVVGPDASEGFLELNEFTKEGEQPGFPEWPKFREKYIAKFGEYHDPAFQLTVSMDVMIAGLKEADSIDPIKVRDAIERIAVFQTLLGPASFGGENVYGIAHELMVPMPVVEVRDMKIVPLGMITTEDVMEALGEK